MKAVLCFNCNQVIVSRHLHDFVRCSCGECFVDGGRDYLRYGGKSLRLVEIPEPDKAEDLTCPQCGKTVYIEVPRLENVEFHSLEVCCNWCAAIIGLLNPADKPINTQLYIVPNPE